MLFDWHTIARCNMERTRDPWLAETPCPPGRPHACGQFFCARTQHEHKIDWMQDECN